MENPFDKETEILRHTAYETIKNGLKGITRKNIVTELENIIYNKTIEDAKNVGIFLNWSNTKILDIYSSYLHSIMSNLDNNGQCIDVNGKELLKKYKINELINMDIKTYNEDIWKKSNDELTARKLVINQPIIDSNSRFYCRKCRSKNVVITTAQLRGADEATNILITCQECGVVTIK